MPDSAPDTARPLIATAASSRWRTVEHRRLVDSTQDVARALVAAGRPMGIVALADGQMRGRGRRGRHWTDHHVTADGRPANLAASFAVPATGQGAPTVPLALVPFAAGLAIVDTLAGFDLTAALKWPNDVLVGDDKVAGILVERHTVRLDAGDPDVPAGDGHIDVVIVGCGVNLDWRAIAGGDDAPRAWTSLAEVAGASFDRDEVFARLADALDHTLALDGAEVRRRYRRHCDTLGRQVRVELPDGAVHVGRAHDVDDAGRLGIEPSGHWLHAADVVHLRPDA
ncbi:MAG: biotin--[acetyl-CoA-carboxylase] ligase [Nitriliruptoraceae bacterium]